MSRPDEPFCSHCVYWDRRSEQEGGFCNEPRSERGFTEAEDTCYYFSERAYEQLFDTREEQRGER
jgi:hypothetical protein